MISIISSPLSQDRHRIITRNADKQGKSDEVKIISSKKNFLLLALFWRYQILSNTLTLIFKTSFHQSNFLKKSIFIQTIYQEIITLFILFIVRILMQRNTKYYSENKNITNNKIKYEVF